jgi:hypothetical protein
MGTDKRKSFGLNASRMALGVAALSVAGAASAAGKKPEFSYFLPRTALTVEITQELNSCDLAPDGMPDIDTTITVTPVREADPNGLVRLDVGAGFLAKRTVKLELNSDGTLASFNSQSEGQAGAAIAAAAKLALKIATVALIAGGAESGHPTCTSETQSVMKKKKDLADRITKLETLIEEGKGGPAQTSLLADLRARLVKRREALTMKAALAVPAAPAAPGARLDLAGPSLAEWFGKEVPNGFSLVVIEDPAMPKSLVLADARPENEKIELTYLDENGNSRVKLHKDVIYRKGVPGIVLAVDVRDQKCLVADTPSEAIDCVRATDSGTVIRAVFPQFSGLYSIPAGKGGLFGSRQAGIKFDANGVPVSLEYGSTSASTDLATLAGTATDGVQTLRDAPLANLERAIKLEEAKAKLKKLQAEAAAAEESE